MLVIVIETSHVEHEDDDEDDLSSGFGERLRIELASVSRRQVRAIEPQRQVDGVRVAERER